MEKLYRGILALMVMFALTACEAMVFGTETDPEAQYAEPVQPAPTQPEPEVREGTISIILKSEIEQEQCLLLGQGFNLTLRLIAPEDWKNIDGSDTRHMFFRLITQGQDTDSIVVKSEPEGMTFVLTPDQLATKSFDISVDLGSGEPQVITFEDFPFFRYTRRDGASNFCLKLPEPEDFNRPSQPAPAQQA